MGKSGPGDHLIGPSLIIENSGKRPAWVRHRDWLLSAVMWLLYLYFIREAIIELYELVGGSFAWGFSGAEPPHSPVISRSLAMIQDYGIVILANSIILIVWALYNQFRFRRLDRRHAPRPVDVADLAALYGFPADDVANWQQSRILVMQHAPEGGLLRVISKEPGPIPAAREGGAGPGAT